jgi:hypothetical protein
MKGQPAIPPGQSEGAIAERNVETETGVPNRGHEPDEGAGVARLNADVQLTGLPMTPE